MIRASAALAALLVGVSAGAASFDFSVDPRFELLGVVRLLAGKAGPAKSDYRDRVATRFAPFREHPAVQLYRELAAREEGLATLPIYYTNPPELSLKEDDADIHYVNGPGEAEETQRFLHELRDFARVSDFSGFFRDNAADYAALENAERASSRGVDPVAAIEAYLGLRLSARSHYVLSPLSAATRAFISPYPLPPANAGARSFEVYSVSPDLVAKGFSNVLWHEPLFVFIDPAFYYFEKLNIPDLPAFYGRDVAACRATSPDCVKHFAVAAILEHIDRRAGVPPTPDADRHPASALERRYVAALSSRLDEYDAHRDRYPTWWDFLPRWFSVFQELAPVREPRKLTIPTDPKIRAAADFFDPPTIAALLRAASR